MLAQRGDFPNKEKQCGAVLEKERKRSREQIRFVMQNETVDREGSELGTIHNQRQRKEINLTLLT